MATPKKQPKYFDFSQRLRRKATNARCSQKDIAMILSTSPAIVKKWFDGLSVPTGKKLNGLANMVKTTPEWLLNGDTVELEPVEATTEQTQTAVTEVPVTEAPVTEIEDKEPENLLEQSTDDSVDTQDQYEAQAESSHDGADDETDEVPVFDFPSSNDAEESLDDEEVPVFDFPTPKASAPTTKSAAKKKVTRAAKPKLTLKENIAKLEAELKVLRKQAKLEKRVEHEALGDLAFTMADKDAGFAKLLLESLQTSLESRPRQVNAKALTEVMLAVEKKVLSDDQNADA